VSNQGKRLTQNGIAPLANSSDLTSKGGAGFVTHFGLLFGVCFVDDFGTHSEVLVAGRRTSPRPERTEQDQPGGRRATDFDRRGNSQTLRHPPDRVVALVARIVALVASYQEILLRHLGLKIPRQFKK